MQSKRDGLIPIGEALADLPGPIQAIRKTPPPVQRAFTLSDQVNQLVSASEADPDLGFMARLMALCCLPRTNPGNRHQYKRGAAKPFRLIGSLPTRLRADLKHPPVRPKTHYDVQTEERAMAA